MNNDKYITTVSDSLHDATEWMNAQKGYKLASLQLVSRPGMDREHDVVYFYIVAMEYNG